MIERDHGVATFYSDSIDIGPGTGEPHKVPANVLALALARISEQLLDLKDVPIDPYTFEVYVGVPEPDDVVQNLEVIWVAVGGKR